MADQCLFQLAFAVFVLQVEEFEQVRVADLVLDRTASSGRVLAPAPAWPPAASSERSVRRTGCSSAGRAVERTSRPGWLRPRRRPAPGLRDRHQSDVMGPGEGKSHGQGLLGTRVRRFCRHCRPNHGILQFGRQCLPNLNRRNSQYVRHFGPCLKSARWCRTNLPSHIECPHLTEITL